LLISARSKLLRPVDLLGYALKTVARHRLRTVLLLAAMAIGVAAVLALTALGEGARRYVTDQFSALGTNLLIVLPGRNETRGGHPPMLGETPRDLTIDDAFALTRSRLIRRIAPLLVGSAAVSVAGRSREITILGSTAEFLPIRHLAMAQGRFLPALDPRRAAPLCVLGSKVRNELFAAEPALGRWVRIGERRFRVIGVLAPKGQSLGTDVDDIAIIPLTSAQNLFNTASLFRILIEVLRREDMIRAQQTVVDLIRARHEGEEDITVITQDSILATFNKILATLTLAVAGIAAISLVVAGILIMNVMLVSVAQRTQEIGLLKALGANPHTIRRIFLGEAALLALWGAGIGLLIGAIGVVLGRLVYPAFPLATPWWAVLAALGVAVGTGLLFALLPARRAARLDPVRALGGH
jgi:putative ABC transport system permease protein